MMEKQISILDMAERSLPHAWERCVNAALQAKIVVEDEIEKSKNAHVGPFFNVTHSLRLTLTIGTSQQTDHIKRTFDYEPFMKEFIACLHHEDLLEPILSGKAEGDVEIEVSTGKGKKKS